MVFVGNGYAKDFLVSLTKELGIADRVLFHEVIYDRELLMSIYARADIFLFPSLYDNAPLVLREAAGMKTPGVLIKGSKASEVIQNGQNGFLCEETITHFAETVVKVLSKKDNLAVIGAEAQRTLRRTWESIIDYVIKKYQHVLENWPHQVSER